MSYQHQYINGTPIHFPLGKLAYVGRNYAERARELNNLVPTEPLLFIESGSYVVLMSGGPSLSQERGSIYYEAEAAMLIDKPLSRGSDCEEVLGTISDYTPVLDLTLRKAQAKLKEKSLPWELAESLDGAGILSPFVNTDQFPDPTGTDTRLIINGEACQDGSSRDMLNSIVPLIQHIAGYFSLQTGDVVLVGMPSGVGPLNSDDGLLLELPGTNRFEIRMF